MQIDAPPGAGVRVSRLPGGEYRRKEPQAHSANHTRFREAIIDAHKVGGDVCACPFGCQEEDLDEHWYCHHLVGFTDDPKLGYEPLVLCPDGHRRVKPRTRRRGKETLVVREPCRKDDHLEWLNDKGWAWVYRRDVPAPPRDDDDIEDEDDLDAAIAREQAANPE